MDSATLETIVHTGESAARRILALGLTVEGIMQAVREGENARAQATEHDPIIAGGFDAYRYRVRALRNIFCPMSWTVFRDCGLEGILSPCGGRHVITRAGDEDVGVPTGHPSPKRDMGGATGRAVANNALLLDQNWLNVPSAQRPAFETWMLLVFRSGDQIRCELSLPSEVPAGDDKPLAWIERIMLPDLDLDPAGKRTEEVEQVVVDVPVVRKR